MNPDTGADIDDPASLHAEIADLEARLAQARSRLPAPAPAPASTLPETSTAHLLLLLSDSALPLGSFAFSSGLESYIAHQRAPRPAGRDPVSRFLQLSLHSLSASTLPFVIASHTYPSTSAHLDDLFDASTTCAVARRASISQGRALASVFSKSLSASIPPATSFTTYRGAGPHGHFGVAWGLVCSVCGVDLASACYLFLLGHAKATLSAAVRLSLVGPYQAQALLAAVETQEALRRGVERGAGVRVEDAAQSVPVLDVYQGRHEVLYSRVFNS